jgi:hypothetical protein
MRFRLKEGVPPAQWWTVEVGNAYAIGPNSKAGNDKTCLRVLIGITDGKAFFVNLNIASGDIVGVIQKPAALVERMIPIGKVVGLADLKFDVTPLGGLS